MVSLSLSLPAKLSSACSPLATKACSMTGWTVCSIHCGKRLRTARVIFFSWLAGPCHTRHTWFSTKNAKSYSMKLVGHILSRHHEFGVARLTADWFSCCCHSLNRKYVMGLQAMIRMDDVQTYKTELVCHICRTDGCSAKRQTRVWNVGRKLVFIIKM